jgi:protein TonB
MRVARSHADDRTRWQTEVSDARQRLFVSDTRIASLSDIPTARSASNQMSGRTTAPPPAATNQTTQPAPANVRTSAPAAAPPSAPAAGATTAAATPSAPVSIGSLLTKARRRESPNYPSNARSAGIRGVVTVFLLLNEKGDVETVERADGPALLQASAADAARRWKFNTTIINGQPVRVRGYLSFDFKP